MMKVETYQNIIIIILDQVNHIILLENIVTFLEDTIKNQIMDLGIGENTKIFQVRNFGCGHNLEQEVYGKIY